LVAAQQDARPNILWITTEDIGAYIGAYGDPLSETPSLDRLAGEGLRSDHAYANFPVCAPARATLIFGVYASTLDTEHMRSFRPVPPWFRLLPQYLRQAGYYCSNNSKTDWPASCTRPWRVTGSTCCVG
jgi:arylsulfatase A-like enzyme